MHTELIEPIQDAYHKKGRCDEVRELIHEAIYTHYAHNPRTYPWRTTDDPYHILLSEIMLQQTQTDRVRSKYDEFLTAYPAIEDLAHTPLPDLLARWKGLGYNRRALALKRTAQDITKNHNGSVPNDFASLIRLPGIGAYTANAILTFAYRQPRVFIETNIRRVFLHLFFPTTSDVRDTELLPLIEWTLDTENPREWYYALMDYGSSLKRHVPNPNRRSKHYTRQARFEGSNRQARGRILSLLIEKSPRQAEDFLHTGHPKTQITQCLAALTAEGFIIEENGAYALANHEHKR